MGPWLGLAGETPTPPQPVRTVRRTSEAKQETRRSFLKCVIPGFSPKIFLHAPDARHPELRVHSVSMLSYSAVLAHEFEEFWGDILDRYSAIQRFGGSS